MLRYINGNMVDFKYFEMFFKKTRIIHFYISIVIILLD